MKAKEIELLKEIINIAPCTANQLADRVGVSIRSIKSYVREINKQYPNTILSSNAGYDINKGQIKDILSSLSSEVPQTNTERQSYIISNILKSNKPVNIYDLCDELYISLSTLKVDLNRIKRKLMDYSLELVVNGDNITIKGLEKNKRRIQSSMLYEESNINFVNIDSIQKSFANIDISFIKQTVLDTFEKYRYYVNDYSLINLILHITISIDRIENNNFNTEISPNDSINKVDLNEFEMAQEIASKIGEQFHIDFNEAEVFELYLLLISRATNIDYKNINMDNLEDFIGEDCLNLVKKLIQDINSNYYIDLNESEFFIRFALHIKNLTVRSKNNYFSRNPLAKEIKTSCPLIYDMSVNLAQTMKSMTGISINDDEIAYIAFHLGSTLEAQKSLNSKVTAVLYCPDYYNMETKIANQINTYFNNELLITNIVTDEKDVKNNDYDLIITTIQLSFISNVPVCYVGLFFGEKEKQALSLIIRQIQKSKAQKDFKNNLSLLLSPDLFEKNHNFENKFDCIKYLSKKLENLNYVNNHFVDEVMQRENMSSTGFGSFAIPHAIKMYAIKTAFAVLINDSPIPWDGSDVHIVILMCFNKNERYIFNEIYDPITQIMTDPDNIKKLVKTSTYSEFIDTMVSLL